MSSFGDKLAAMGIRVYSDYCRTRHWKFLRRKLAPRGSLCCACGTDKRICLHHVSYERIGVERDEDLIRLCAPCHQKVHDCLDAAFVGFPVTFKVRHTDEIFYAATGTLWSVARERYFTSLGKRQPKRRRPKRKPLKRKTRLSRRPKRIKLKRPIKKRKAA